MSTNNKYYQLMPENILQDLPDIESILRSSIKGYSTDCLKEIISIVCCNIQKSEGTAPLLMTFINRLVPQGQFYLTGLVNLGIIHRSGIPIKGQTCYKYYFAIEYDSKYLSFPLKNAKLIRRIEKVHNEKRRESLRSIWGRSEQVRYLNQLTIDKNYIEYLKNFETGTDQYNAIVRSATRIINRIPLHKIDTTSGRFHSNITNLAKGLRPYLRIKGEPLVNIDIRNSQPYLSTIILTNPGKVSWLTENSAFALLLQTLKVSVNKADVKNYISLVVTGQIYEYLVNEFKSEGIVLTRDDAKIQMLRILFARNRTPKDEINRKCRRIFRSRFPSVHRIFSKVRGSERGDKFHNYKRFAILLQKIEAYLMLDVILKRIYRELPGTIAVTIHDSVMTGILTNNVMAVRKIMTDELNTYVGFQPQIKIEGLLIEKEEEEGNNRTIKQYVITNAVTLN